MLRVLQNVTLKLLLQNSHLHNKKNNLIEYIIYFTDVQKKSLFESLFKNYFALKTYEIIK